MTDICAVGVLRDSFAAPFLLVPYPTICLLLAKLFRTKSRKVIVRRSTSASTTFALNSFHIFAVGFIRFFKRAYTLTYSDLLQVIIYQHR